MRGSALALNKRGCLLRNFEDTPVELAHRYVCLGETRIRRRIRMK